ncbi:MAG TPA: glycosyltransferase [Acidobacteriaceae bacterium]|nr:glycosyltransferase [Acidobacteriaceae bacterium]
MEPLNVLLVSYVFPPVGGTGVMRAASLARYLPGENIRLDVLTARNPAAVGNDPTLLKDIPPSVTVHRTLTLDLPFGVKKAIKRFVVGTKSSAKPAGQQAAPAGRKKPGLLKRILDNVLLPDPQVTWFPVLSRAAPRIIRERKIDLVLITVPAFSNLLLIKKLRKEFPHLPIVADFRDEWIATSFELVSFSFSDSPRAEQTARRIEAETVANATAVVAVTESARNKIHSRYPEQPDEKFQLVPNGFDATRMTRTAAATPRNDGKVLLTHVGTVYPTTAPGSLVDAIKLLPADVRSRLKLRFIGHIEEPRFREALLGLGDMVELFGYMPQREALAAMQETDYVLLLNTDPLNVGNKFYEYAGGGKPILGAVHPGGETRILLEQMRAGWWAGIDDVEGIRKLLLDAVNRGDSLLQEFRPDTERIAQYERAVLARRYARLLHGIAGRQQGSDANETRPTLVQDLQEC